MSTNIEWCDETVNLVTGCKKISPGCRSCYALPMSARLAENPKLSQEKRDAYSQATSRVGFVPRFSPGTLYWTKKITPIPGALDALAGKLKSWHKPRRVFIQSMGDLFHDEVPFELIDQCLALVATNRQHTAILLTKRPARMDEYFARRGYPGRLQDAHLKAGRELLWGNAFQSPFWPLPNLWLGVSVCTQTEAEDKIPILLDIPAKVRFISVEPMLEEINLTRLELSPDNVINSLGGYGHQMVSNPEGDYWKSYNLRSELDWVICGCETGPRARPMDPEWARSLRDQCKAAGVPFFMKKVTTKGDLPADLNVRELPNA